MSLRIPNPAVWTDKMYDQLFTDCWHPHLRLVYKQLKIVPFMQKSVNQEIIETKMHEITSLWKVRWYKDESCVTYFEQLERAFPRLTDYMNEVSASWAINSQRLMDDDCQEMTDLIDQIAFFLQSLYDYNQKRRDLGLAVVSQIDPNDWQDVVVQWQYRVGGDKYCEHKPKISEIMLV